mmetsp:Transcript_18699/g.28383  ORF Transcript_18699/g.28383 Transcript_18699/m.28383 type:complete len:411 (+) Transcript_18699:85-1317(+)
MLQRTPITFFLALLIAAANVVSGSSESTSTSFKLIQKTRLSPDSCLLRFALPASYPSTNLGHDPLLPTCIKVTVPITSPLQECGDSSSCGCDGSGSGSVEKKKKKTTLSKSYSPTSHPSTLNYFELVVKSYPLQVGGGVGAHLCNLDVGNVDVNVDVDVNADNVIQCDAEDTCADNGDGSSTSGDHIIAMLKSARMMHGSPTILNRWDSIGLVAGGTGIAPLLQLAKIVLESESKSESEKSNNGSDSDTTVHLLYINRRKEDILMRREIDDMVEKHEGRFKVTYSLTQEDVDGEDDAGSTSIGTNTSTHSNTNSSNPNIALTRGRGSSRMALAALPPPASLQHQRIDSPSTSSQSTMIFVCGRDGFVESWGGPVGRAPISPDGTKGKKIQGPLLGWLRDAGYDASEVFKY